MIMKLERVSTINSGETRLQVSKPVTGKARGYAYAETEYVSMHTYVSLKTEYVKLNYVSSSLGHGHETRRQQYGYAVAAPQTLWGSRTLRPQDSHVASANLALGSCKQPSASC